MPLAGHSEFWAEREGFEPPEVLPSTVFKTAAIDHSAISPGAKVIFRLISRTSFVKFCAIFLSFRRLFTEIAANQHFKMAPDVEQCPV